MNDSRKVASGRLLMGASILALGFAAQPVLAQDAQVADGGDEAEIVITGIRASLKESMDVKRDALGVVDAISAEDIGKFPDTNLAESLQRITGVSIDRSVGEGSKVTVRGFGPDFNLVLLNGRQMPASELGSCCAAPASRSFDFANLAAEGVAGVEVYKSGRASLPTGGIGSVINIKTPRPLDRPGFHEPSRPRLVGLRAVDGRSTFLGGAQLTVEQEARRPIGYVTSAVFSPALGEAIGLALVAREHATEGRILVARDLVRGQQAQVRVCSPVHFDPQGERMSA